MIKCIEISVYFSIHKRWNVKNIDEKLFTRQGIICEMIAKIYILYYSILLLMYVDVLIDIFS
jgi:hypothetical protein